MQSLASRSNYGGIPKSNTALQLAGIVVPDNNAKENPKNKVNQKDLPQLLTSTSAVSLKLKQNSKQRVLDKQKKRKKQRVSRQNSFHLFPRRPLFK